MALDSSVGPRAALLRAQHLLRDKRHADALQVCNDEFARGTDEAELHLVAWLPCRA